SSLAEEQTQVGGGIDVVSSGWHGWSAAPRGRPAVVFQDLQILESPAAEPRPDVDMLHVGRRQRGDGPPMLRDQDPRSRRRLIDEGGQIALQLVYRYCLHGQRVL